MLFSFLPVLLLGGLVASESFKWQAPTQSDSRSPCPMLNTLANHGYIPRNGLNITLAQLQDGFATAINLAPDFVVGPWNAGLSTSTTGYNHTVNLHDLVKHNVIEHDGSQSRLDTYFGNANDFNDAVWAQVNASFGDEVVTVKQAAASRVARLAVCAAENPEYNLTKTGGQVGWSEVARFLGVMGNKITGDAPRNFVEIFFQNERLPIEEGWTRPDEVTSTADLSALTALVKAAANVTS